MSSGGGYKPVNTGRRTITTVSKRKRSSISEPVHRPHPPLAPGPIRKPSKSSRRRRRIRKEKASSSVERQWVFSASNSRNLKDKLVLVSYNLLGVDNASNHMDLYYNIPPQHLEWSRRKHLICKEISRYNATILCLQEVDRFDDLDGLLKNRGFQGVHKRRTGEASDGCSIFWKEKLFKLLHHQEIEFDSFGLRNNVAQLCVLEMNFEDPESKLRVQSSEQTSTSPRRLVVGNIHVLFNPKRGDIKLGQVRLLLERAYKLSQEWGNIPVAIAGDLNSTPKSAIYDFVASADLDTQLHDRRQISGQSELDTKPSPFRNHYAVSVSQTNEWSQEELQLATGGQATTHVRHQLKLNSAYAGVPGTHRTRDQCGEPLATTSHSRFQGTVDYIWHTKELVPVRVLETLPTDVLRRTGGLPSEKWGSDHLAIACELGFVGE
ncbi:PREDICTED: carbon catabolite repressor protein 4 homolog 5 [Brassica oleracea var. oleracea]|uniref:Endonuclease/exonuclease/phosphatase domain-containing protein n=1 Tax=Brassica oleracea var. oleracea TaxID=109376 RepID=A0A0D3D0H4_BRAOL|nr:PREDICTED: carbon catabolite repressor protein 4 homolog 5 [Brassica oleracea var. oleracea]